MNGILLIDKPIGWTSFDCVAKVRGEIKRSGIIKPKVGHTGTLDPQATGLLVLVVGQYCKRAQEFSKLDKTYEVTMRLGYTSTTGDAEGVITESLPSYKNVRPHPEVRQIQEVMQKFLGEIEQTPPVYSAIKVNGQRAYKLARAGKEVRLEPRRVTIYNIELTDYNYPEVNFTAEVSSGTYIRSLVEDIGKKLATGAYMSALRRSTVGKFNIDKAMSTAGISAEVIARGLINE